MKIFSKTNDASLWELIAFPCGFLIGIACAILITVIYKVFLLFYPECSGKK